MSQAVMLGDPEWSPEKQAARVTPGLAFAIDFRRDEFGARNNAGAFLVRMAAVRLQEQLARHHSFWEPEQIVYLVGWSREVPLLMQGDGHGTAARVLGLLAVLTRTGTLERAWAREWFRCDDEQYSSFGDSLFSAEMAAEPWRWPAPPLPVSGNPLWDAGRRWLEEHPDDELPWLMSSPQADGARR